MSARLDTLVQLGVLSEIDRQLARTLGALAGGAAAEVLLGTAFASRAVQRGHVCVDLARVAGGPLVDDRDVAVEAPPLPDAARWRAALADSPLVSAAPDEDEPRPLVLDDGGRLYLYRYARYQHRIAQQLAARAQQPVRYHAEPLAESLRRLFGQPGEGNGGCVDRQQLAALIAATRTLCVICGGPGTGKTYTVTKILALLQEQAAAAGGPPLRACLLAPTGKAAARLGESVAAGAADLPCEPAIKAAVVTPASTIHRALGYQPRCPTRFAHDADHPLAADVVVADEMSMVDVGLMAKLLAAVRPDARLILLGDADQLASVEAGAILGDIFAEVGCSPALEALARELCGGGAPVPTGHAWQSRPQPGAALADCMVRLVRSRRYAPGSGIAALAEAVNAGDADAALAAIDDHDDIELCPPEDDEVSLERLVALAAERLGGLGSGSPKQRLAALERFRILCAHRHDALGVEQVGRRVEQRLARAGLLDLDGPYYAGRPVLIGSNDYRTGLFNGDVGIIADGPDDEGRLAYFATRGSDELRALPPGSLPAHDTMFAATVHKSQGSEVDEVALVLPSWRSPILTRELLYTAVTRARCRVHLFASKQSLREAVGKRIERPSGLRAALWGETALP